MQFKECSPVLLKVFEIPWSCNRIQQYIPRSHRRLKELAMHPLIPQYIRKSDSTEKFASKILVILQDVGGWRPEVVGSEVDRQTNPRGKEEYVSVDRSQTRKLMYVCIRKENTKIQKTFTSYLFSVRFPERCSSADQHASFQERLLFPSASDTSLTQPGKF